MSTTTEAITTKTPEAFPAKSRMNLHSTLTSHVQSNSLLTERINMTRKVMQNTLRKMTTGNPAEFSWVHINGERHILGVYRKTTHVWMSTTTTEYTNLVSEILTKEDFTYNSDNHLLRVAIFDYHGKLHSIQDLPLSLLHNDPIAIAQYVREACRAHAEHEYRKNVRAEKAQVSELKGQQTKLQNQLEELQSRVDGNKTRSIKPKSKETKAARKAAAATRKVVTT